MGPFKRQVMRHIRQITNEDMTWLEIIEWSKDKIPELYEILKNDLKEDVSESEIPDSSFIQLGEVLEERNNINI